MLAPSRITGAIHCIPILVQEEPALVRRQLIQDPLRVEQIRPLGKLSTHEGIVTCTGLPDGLTAGAAGRCYS